MEGLPRRKIALGFVLVLFVGAARAGDLSCIGVQGMAVEMRAQMLPADQAAQFSTEIAQVKAYADQAKQEMTRAEKDTDDDYDAIVKANPGASIAQVSQMYHDNIWESAEADGRFAEMLHAQFKVHLDEAEMIEAGAPVPNPSETAELSKMSADFASSHGDALVQAVQSSEAFRALFGVAVAEREAMASGRAIPAVGVARLYYDTPGEKTEPTMQAVAALSGVTVATEAVRTANTLRLGHLLGQDIRDRTFRQELAQKGDSPTWRAVNREVAEALQNLAVADEATRRIANVLPSDPPPADPQQRQQWIGQVANTARSTADDVTLIYRKGEPKVIDALPSKLAPLSPAPVGSSGSSLSASAQ